MSSSQRDDYTPEPHTLVLAPFRALRPVVDGPQLARRLSPPYDVISAEQRSELLQRDPRNAVSFILPEATSGISAGAAAQRTLAELIRTGESAVDDVRALYVYEMAPVDGPATRGLLGAIELRAPESGVILPHEDVMPGPVQGRLELMLATESNPEPIYLIYEGAGAAGDAVAQITEEPLAQAVTSDQTAHRLWRITGRDRLDAIASDLAPRRALIADGHHRYATYRELQKIRRAERGRGPWDRGLALLVNTSGYGPWVEAIHRVLPGLGYAQALDLLRGHATVSPATDPESALARALQIDGFAAVLADSTNTAVISDLRFAEAGPRPTADLLDVQIIHGSLVQEILGLQDDEASVGYAHSIDEALDAAARTDGVALLLRPTPIEAVAALASQGIRMPRKSTLFMPKPTSGLVVRRFADEHDWSGA